MGGVDGNLERNDMTRWKDQMLQDTRSVSERGQCGTTVEEAIYEVQNPESHPHENRHLHTRSNGDISLTSGPSQVTRLS